VPIIEFLQPPLRTGILFVGEDPPADAVKDLSAYQVARFEDAHLTEPGRLATTEAVVFLQNVDKPNRVAHELEKYAPMLLWHDCRVFVHPIPATPDANAAHFRQLLINALDRLQLPTSGVSGEYLKQTAWLKGPDQPVLTPCVHVAEQPGRWTDMARLIQRSPAGFPPGEELEIEAIAAGGQAMAFCPEQEVLVRRAFWNCRSVRLVELTNGLSGVSAFKGYAYLKTGMVGGEWPYTYFVKLGEREKIAVEYRQYETTALENIPYHLGPRLRRDRCNLGHQFGIIVSDYVSGAETLRDCARDGRGAAAIGSLFGNTLVAWRHGATMEDKPLQDYIAELMPHHVPEHRVPLVRAAGSTQLPAELLRLLMSTPSKPVRLGVIHGDLHATNVLARGHDAIVIDFDKVAAHQPLLRDPASLEGGLFVDGFIGDRRNGSDLLASVECLYLPAAFRDTVGACHPGDGSAWFFDCVRQIRMQAKALECAPYQYALTLAATLTKKACNQEDFSHEHAGKPGLSREEVRALAYVLAERILLALKRDGILGRVA
jgi:hypothetical protein